MTHKSIWTKIVGRRGLSVSALVNSLEHFPILACFNFIPLFFHFSFIYHQFYQHITCYKNSQIRSSQLCFEQTNASILRQTSSYCKMSLLICSVNPKLVVHTDITVSKGIQDLNKKYFEDWRKTNPSVDHQTSALLPILMDNIFFLFLLCKYVFKSE